MERINEVQGKREKTSTPRGAARRQIPDLRAFAAQYLVGGVSSSFRLNPFTGSPLYVDHAEGPYIF